MQLCIKDGPYIHDIEDTEDLEEWDFDHAPARVALVEAVREAIEEVKREKEVSDAHAADPA